MPVGGAWAATRGPKLGDPEMVGEPGDPPIVAGPDGRVQPGPGDELGAILAPTGRRGPPAGGRPPDTPASSRPGSGRAGAPARTPRGSLSRPSTSHPDPMLARPPGQHRRPEGGDLARVHPRRGGRSSASRRVRSARSRCSSGETSRWRRAQARPRVAPTRPRGFVPRTPASPAGAVQPAADPAPGTPSSSGSGSARKVGPRPAISIRTTRMVWAPVHRPPILTTPGEVWLPETSDFRSQIAEFGIWNPRSARLARPRRVTGRGTAAAPSRRGGGPAAIGRPDLAA